MTLEVEELFCINHPQTETTLRCNRCEDPICARCAVLTPTGYRCKDCIRGQQKSFDTAEWYDYGVSFILAGFLSYLGSQLVAFLSFFTIFLAPVAGVIIAEAVRMVVRRRRSRLLYRTTTLAVALASLIPILILLLSVLASPGLPAGIMFRLIFQGVYTFLVTSTVYYRLAGIRI
ncbi:MAG: hypothetical protein IBX69_06625 [Anaerolineales bacterium]|nr:hypothetical protein [Anaerolineales bacterium]